MLAATLAAVVVLAAYGAVADQEQMPLGTPSPDDAAFKKRKLTGRFLHITDLHPDIHYKEGATFQSGCHRLPGEKAIGKGKRKSSRLETQQDEDEDEDDEDGFGKDPTKKKPQHDVAGKWGNALTDCDSPMSLIDLTFEWLKKEWAGEIDFVVWTGDSARHDLDRNTPRTPKEIFNSNTLMSQKMIDTFGKKLPIVPSLGNNDIWPHNIIQPGPNRITEGFLRIWKHWIPEEERHIFERGAYFATEVIPDQLAVISLNTLFWFSSNSAVDGCKDRSSDPGALQMDWLEVQLDQLRERGMQVWLTGHVPPHYGVFYDNCYLRYGDLALRFQDTIVGHLFGHQNIDHFFFLDVPELDGTGVSKKDFNASANLDDPAEYSFIGPELRHGPHNLNSGRVKVLGNKADTMKKSLRDSWALLPPPGVLKHKDYAVINVGPSVIPTYIPSARIYSYNITGVSLEADSRQVLFSPLPQDEAADVEEDEDDLEVLKKKKKKYCDKPQNEDKPKCAFKHKPRYSSPESPSRSNKPLSPLGYVQFYLPHIDEKKKPEYEIEYTTFKAKSLLPESLSGEPLSQPPPVPYRMLPGYHPSIGKLTAAELASLDADDDALAKGGNEDAKSKFLQEIKQITPWKMKDLTVNSYVKFARMLVDDKKAWKKFVKLMFVSSGEGE